MPPHFGAYTSYYYALFCHGYIGAGPKYGICPYQPAGALYKHIFAKKTNKNGEKGAKNREKW